MANVKYYRVRTLADLPSSSTTDGDIYFVRETQQIFIWDAVNNTMSEASSQAPVLSVAGRTGNVTLSESDIANLVSDLAGKAALSHTHPESDITNLVSDLAGKAAASHTHAESDITGLVSDLAGKQDSLGFTPENVSNKDTDTSLSANSDTRYSSQKATKAYVDAEATARASAVSAEATARASADSTLTTALGLKLATGVLTAMGAPLPSIKSMRVPAVFQTTTTGSADVTIYTVPSGKRATCIVFIQNQNASTRNYFLKFKRNGTTYTLGASTAVLSNAASSSIGNTFNGWPIGAAGDAFIVNVDGATVNLYGLILEWDDTEPIKSAILEAPVSGNNVVYTCPANKIAILANFAPAINAPIRLYNQSGTTRTYKWHWVPNGGSPGTGNLISKTGLTVTNNNNSNDTANMIAMAAGDTLVINLDANAPSSLAVVMNIIEIPA